MTELPERFWSKVDKTDDCWLWTAATSPTGYGRFGMGHSQVMQAHRVAYEALVGPIPAGLELDHLCRNRACVNPDHLEAVTHPENIRRSSWTQRTHCKNGHEFTPENTRLDPAGFRRCRTCNRDRLRALKAIPQERWRNRQEAT